MARTRFVPDTGLTVRMTTVHVPARRRSSSRSSSALMYAVDSPGCALLIGVVGIGVAFFQW